MDLDWLAPREREIAAFVYSRDGLSVSEICSAFGPVSNEAVRAALGRLREKGVIRRRRSGHRFVYFPASGEEQENAPASR